MGRSWRNVRRGTACLVCGKDSWCSRSEDGAWALCRRVDAGGIHRVDAAGMDYWLHRTGDGPAQAPEIPKEPRAERAEASDLDRVYRAVLRQLSLSPAHRQALTERGLDGQAIEAGMYRSLPARGRAELARAVLERFPAHLPLAVPGFHARETNGRLYMTVAGPAGLLIPVRDLEGRVVALKVRRDTAGDDEARYVYVSSTAYGGPGPGAPVHVPAARLGQLPGDDELEVQTAERLAGGVVRITEGELKAHIAMHLTGVLTISVAGVSAWRSALPVLRALRPARVLLAFDQDAARNPHVARATEATAEALASEGWEVGLEAWDSERAKGIDDALAAGVAIEIRIRKASDHTAEAPSASGTDLLAEIASYRPTPQGLLWDRPTKDGSVETRLTNFTARIAGDVVEDDGAEVRRRFEIEAELNGSRRSFAVAAESFGAMGWATEHLGARAIVFPGFGIKDHARAAVQILSGAVPERRVYSHTGWRQLGDHWAYLHAGGAVGAGGSVPGVEVALPDALSRLELPAPPGPEELADAIRASLYVLDVAPDAIAFPLLSAVYRAVLGEADFSLHLAGPSGAGKSELAALAQRHFGAGMDARNLPGSWSSTANALEGLAFAAKDALLVVDDFAPAGSTNDAERAHREADRILRAQGNRSGRQRMRADGSLRPAKPPRGLIVSTGEDVPRGQSLRARMLVLELAPGDLDWDTLTACQTAAGQGALARALSGYLRFVAGCHDEIKRGMAKKLPELREAAARSGGHRRTPELVANLATGFGLFLLFAHHAGAVSEVECEKLWDRAWMAIGDAAASQAHHQAAAEPAQRFVELLRSAIASGRAHVAGPDGNRPDPSSGACGWRLNAYGTHEPKGDRVGWLEGDALYLDPDAAYAAVQRLGQEIGDRIAIVPQTLRKRLNERGILRSIDGQRQRLTVRRSFEGQRREVLHLAAGTLSSPAKESDLASDLATDNDPDREGGAISWSGFSARWDGSGRVARGYPTRQNRPSTCGYSAAGRVGTVPHW